MSRGPGITQSQPGGGNILFFGNPPYPTTGYLRAGNDAGVILTYRNNANTKDLPGIGVGPQGGANQDFFLFAGVLAGELTSAPGASPVVGVLRPPTTIGGGGGVAFGDTFTPFSQVVAESLYAVSHYDGIHTPTQAQLHFVTDGAGEHTELSTQDASLILNAGAIHTRVELFNIGSTPGRDVFRPYNANTVGLGDAANPWYGLFLKAGDVTVPPLTFDPAGVAPGAPADGQAWFTAAGLFYRAGGVTVGPLAAAGAGSVAIQNGGVPLAGGPFSTLNYVSGGVTNGGGGVANIAAGGGGVTGSGTGGNLPIWSGAGASTALTDSAMLYENFGGNGYTLQGFDFRPSANEANKVGANNRAWLEVWTAAVIRNSANDLDVRNNGTGNVTLTTSNAAANVVFLPNGVQTLGVSRSGPDSIVQVYPGATNAVSLGGPTRAFNGLYITGALAITLTNQATTVGAAAGTLTNAPTAGNPTGYLRVNINGAVGKIPYWV